MALEITVQETMTIRKSTANIDEQTRPNQFTADMTGTKGPTPGLITVPTTGKVVNLTALSTMGGMCRFYNRSLVNFVTIGVYDGTRFYPFCELLPGEFTRVRLSRYLNQEFIGSSSGTNADVNALMIIADTAECEVKVEAYDK
jgi:hypothetical protein